MNKIGQRRTCARKRASTQLGVSRTSRSANLLCPALACLLACSPAWTLWLCSQRGLSFSLLCTAHIHLSLCVCIYLYIWIYIYIYTIDCEYPILRIYISMPPFFYYSICFFYPLCFLHSTVKQQNKQIHSSRSLSYRKQHSCSTKLRDIHHLDLGNWSVSVASHFSLSSARFTLPVHVVGLSLCLALLTGCSFNRSKSPIPL